MRLGVDPTSPGDIDGLAPYGRIAVQKSLGGGTAELGAFGFQASIHPGLDRTTGRLDRYTDLGIDGSYIMALPNTDVVTLNARYTHEDQALEATCVLDGAFSGCANNELSEMRADVSYYWRNAIGGTIQVFDTTGSPNPTLYAANRTFRPDSAGVTFQLDATPFGGEAQPRRLANVRVGAQYTIYTQFNGSGTNYNGAGANAGDNNTFRVFTWFTF
jgi:hypothetical protein